MTSNAIPDRATRADRSAADKFWNTRPTRDEGRELLLIISITLGFVVFVLLAGLSALGLL
jgi:hypothetical protein